MGCGRSPERATFLAGCLVVSSGGRSVVKAKQMGMVTAVKPIIIALRKAGLWLSDDLVNEILQQAGES